MKLHWQIAWGIVLGYIGIQLANAALKGLLFVVVAAVVMGSSL